MSDITRTSISSAPTGYDEQKGEKDAKITDNDKALSVSSRPSSWDIEHGTTEVLTTKLNPLQRFAYRLEEVSGMEARGIERVVEADRKAAMTWDDYVQMFSIWFSANLTLNNLIPGLLGPLLFGLSMKEAMIIGPFGSFFGSACSGYTSTFGPMSGNRTLVTARYTMGWWPSRLCVLLNIVIMVGYGLVDILAAGQILSAVNGAGLSIITGTVVSAVISLAIVLFGIGVFHKYERYAWMPQLAVLFVLAGVAGPSFDVSSVTEAAGPAAAADRMSYFWLCASSAIAWSPATADFYVYFPPTTKRWMTWLCTTVGLTLSISIMVLFGAGLGSGVLSKQSWGDAYDVSMGALIVESYAPLGAFGHFCSVVLALGLISNNVPSTYSAALSFQLLGSWCEQIPRIFWTVIATIIYTVCACVGKDVLFVVFQNFLALMGYWTLIWVSLTLVEEFLFRRRGGGYDWTAWHDKKRLPIGLAALVAFLVGWAGAVLGMWQTYFTGPLAKLVGEGIDLGMPVGACWAVIVFIPLRWLELKHVGR